MDQLSTDQIVQLLTRYGMPLLWALVILVVGLFAAKIVAASCARLMQKSKVDATLIGFIRNLVYFALLAFIIIAALGKLGIQTTSFAAVVAAAGLAIGLSLQGTLGNFAAGVMLIAFRPFKAGDFVEAGGTSGSVEEIQLFSTRMKTADNKQIIVPNGNIISANITNYSAKQTRRIDMVIGVSYQDDLKKVRSVLEDILAADERVLTEPPLTIGVLELADSSVNFAVRPWVRSGDYWPALFDLQEEIKTRFDSEGICIPYPQQDVHLFKQN